MTTKAKLKPPTKWANPDMVGESEYRAIHELCMDMWKQEHDIDIVRGILQQFIDTATGLLGDIGEPAGKLKTATYNAADNSLTCPHCKFEGLRNGIPATGKYGRGFKFVEDVPSYRSIAELRNGTLMVDTDYQDDAEGAENCRLECRNCLAESALPEGLSFDFDGEDDNETECPHCGALVPGDCDICECGDRVR